MTRSKNVLSGCEIVKTGFADPLIGMLADTLSTWTSTLCPLRENTVRKIQWHDTMRELQARTPPHPQPPPPPESWRALFLWYSFILSPCLSLSPLLHTPPLSSSSSLYNSLSFICLLPLVLPFCQQPHLIKAESSFSALSGEWRSLGEIKCLPRKNLDFSKLAQIVYIVTS